MRMLFVLAICLLTAACTARVDSNADPVQDLPEWEGKTIQEMVRALGKPTEETEQTVGKLPTKAWHHGIVFSVYPKNKPENHDVIIKIYSWKQGDYHVLACCHLVKKAWLVLGAKRIHKDVRF